MNSFKITKLYFNFLLLAIVFISLGGFSTSANAVTAGCDPAKYNLMKQVSELRTLYDVGATEEIIPKPDSVLQLSCFSQASQVSAEKGGQIFSGDFKADLRNVIEGVTNNISGNFVGSLMDKYSIPYVAGWGTAAFNCDNMRTVWNMAQNDGINTAAKFLDFDEILDAADGTTPLPPASTILQQNLRTADVGTFVNDVRSALSTPPAPIPLMNVDANANGYLDLCDVMTNLNGGVPPAGC